MSHPTRQLDHFRTAVAALGGQVAAARALGISERTLRAYHAGTRALHANVLQRTARALIAHADLCRALDRRLSPAFAANLTPEQRATRPPSWAIPAN